jgi:cyclic pyranopterin monophosphate synthase
MSLTHINEQGNARMVDVSDKEVTTRVARAQAVVHMQAQTLTTIREGGIKKGDVLAVAQVAGIMGAKQTPSLIPMCHPLMLAGVDIDFEFDEAGTALIIRSLVKTTGKTGVEMEAITAVSIAALTVYDMCKAIDRWMEISDIQLLEKCGGKSGHLHRNLDNELPGRKGSLHSICISPERGQLKEEIDEAQLIAGYGIENDGHVGDWGRQVTCLSWESVLEVNREKKLNIGPGQFAENLLIQGVDLSRVGVGDRLRIGTDTILEVTQVGKEDHPSVVTRTFGVSLLPFEGLFCKVMSGGKIKKGDSVEVLDNV